MKKLLKSMETKFNFKSAICTSREQSEKLLALGLKKETADCCYYYYDGEYLIAFAEDAKYPSDIPAWSLHRLLCMLPRCVEGGYHLAISYDHIEYRTTYNEVTTWWRGGGNTYDMIIETIEWLIKEGYFNKKYLV